jgi:UDP-arabinose 4-epimerase
MPESEPAVLVVGGAGFIGSHACKRLAAEGYRPVVVDDLSRGHREAVKWGPLEVANTQDRKLIAEILDRHQPAAAMHFANFTSVSESVADPRLYYANNVDGTAALLDAVLRRGPIPFIFSSSAAVYGHPKNMRVTEDHPLAPINPYGANKVAVERMLVDAGSARRAASGGAPLFQCRRCGPEGEIGENHDPETRDPVRRSQRTDRRRRGDRWKRSSPGLASSNPKLDGEAGSGAAVETATLYLRRRM